MAESQQPADVVQLFRIAARSGAQVERYYFTYCRRLGANKHFAAAGAAPGLRFGVWAPNAKPPMEVVFGKPSSGYIADDGTGIDPAQPVSHFDTPLRAGLNT